MSPDQGASSTRHTLQIWILFSIDVAADSTLRSRYKGKVSTPTPFSLYDYYVVVVVVVTNIHAIREYI